MIKKEKKISLSLHDNELFYYAGLGMLDFEKKFIHKLMHRDKTAFSKFYLDTVDYFFRYLRGRYPTLSRANIEDILSGFYLKIWNTQNYKEQENFKAYVWTIFKNHTKDYFKKKRELSFGHINTSEDQKIEDGLVSEEDVMQLMDSNFKKEKIQQAISQLPESEGEVFFLKFVEQRTHEEIGKIVDISPVAVRKRLSRAVKRLKKILKEE